MNVYLAPKKSSFYVANLRNSWLLRAIGALNLNLFAHNLLLPEQTRGSLEHPDLLLNSHLVAKSSSFCVANLLERAQLQLRVAVWKAPWGATAPVALLYRLAQATSQTAELRIGQNSP